MKTFPALLFVILFAAVSTNALAQYTQRLGFNYYMSGIPTFEFYVRALEQNTDQKQTNWCWAACVQMVLNYHGLYVTQEQVVARIFGKLVNQPAKRWQIKRALSGWAFNYRGGLSYIFSKMGFNSANEIVYYLSRKWPFIVGLRNPNNDIGHAYVLTAIYYSYDRFHNVVPHKVVLRDPCQVRTVS